MITLSINKVPPIVCTGSSDAGACDKLKENDIARYVERQFDAQYETNVYSEFADIKKSDNDHSYSLSCLKTPDTLIIGLLVTYHHDDDPDESNFYKIDFNCKTKEVSASAGTEWIE